MKKEILNLVVLGLQVKKLLTIENLSNALTNLSEKQQLQWVETVLQNRELEFKENKNFDSNATMLVLKVTQREDVLKSELVAYVKWLLNCTLKEAKDLVYDNNVFKLEVSRCDTERVIGKLQTIGCIVEIT